SRWPRAPPFPTYRTSRSGSRRCLRPSCPSQELPRSSAWPSRHPCSTVPAGPRLLPRSPPKMPRPGTLLLSCSSSSMPPHFEFFSFIRQQEWSENHAEIGLIFRLVGNDLLPGHARACLDGQRRPRRKRQASTARPQHGASRKGRSHLALIDEAVEIETGDQVRQIVM